MELEVDMTKIVVLSIISLLTLIGNCLVILAIVARNIKITRQGYFPCAFSLSKSKQKYLTEGVFFYSV